MSLLSDFVWKPKYDSDDRNLLGEFYEPALACAIRYDRTTGYFSSGVLTLSSRGIEGLVRNGGRMRLVVGCTLGPDDVEAITRGESLRNTVEARLMRQPLVPADAPESAALALLSWMVAQGMLEVKVAIPCDTKRRPVAGNVVFHEKAGIVEDKTGDRLAFNGSINETPQGWAGNWESFHVFASWSGDDARRRVEVEEEGFGQLWNDKKKQCIVIDVPQAVRDDLLRFLPLEGVVPSWLGPPSSEAPPPRKGEISAVPPPPPEPEPTKQDLRRLVWSLIRQAPAWPGVGERVGEATSIVTPWPHQVRAFSRLYAGWPPRLLIADEVGLGKTIEAGLVLRQAILAGLARRVLILAPKAVLSQWQLELREKFNLRWPIYDGHRLVWPLRPGETEQEERKVARSAWHLEPFVLVSSQLMRRLERQPELVQDAEPWDLVILDEAHHARRKGGGLTKDRKPNNLLALMQALRTKSAGLLLLTATPMQVAPVEVWDLLSLLGLPDAWTEGAFLRFFEIAAHANPSHEDFEVLASLFRQAEARFGEVSVEESSRSVAGGSRLAAKKILAALRDPAQTERRRLESNRRRAAVKIMRLASPVSRLISRHTRELLRRYFKAGLISTPVAERYVDDVFIELSPAERSLYERVEDYISTTYNQASAAQKNAVGFVMTIYRRRIASSFAALAQTLEGRLRALSGGSGKRLSDEEDLPDDAPDEGPDDADEAEGLEREALELEEKADLDGLLASARKLPADTKTERLRGVLTRLNVEGYSQVLVFTQYTDTMDFLREQLVGSELRILCFSGRGGERLGPDGRWHARTRDDVKREFRRGDADVLLCTDAAAEGLNFQFCGALVNYDMPWNPMRVEQRIGRIDRLGQKFQVLRIVNLHYENTVETDVYRALRARIGLFSQFVGKLQPILAALPRGLQQATLTAKSDRERHRQELVNELDTRVGDAEASPFDLDEITEAELNESPGPEPAYCLDDLDLLLLRPELLPPGVEVTPLGGPREYRYSAPGLHQPIRVTTDPRYFEDHPGSLELWSPGSPVFPNDENLDQATLEELAGVRGLRELISGRG